MSATESDQAALQGEPAKSKLHLPSLEIHNFRAFEHLQIEQLGRVNLITGRNNVGKTSLLEALYLFARTGAALALRELLISRDEFGADSGPELPGERWPSDEREPSVYPLTIRHLFHGRKDFDDFPEPIRIGPVGDPDEALQIGARWYRETLEQTSEGVKVPRVMPLSPNELAYSLDRRPYVSVKMGKGPTGYISMTDLSDRRSYVLRHGALAQDKHGLFVKAAGVENARILRLWRNVHLFPLEGEVSAALRIIAPDVDRASVTIDEESRPGPVPIVKLQGSDQPFPLRTMGDGMVRLFGIALALVNATDGFLMLDEIENGLHYSIQPDVWRLIFRVASRLNVQVFATTHSWDCIEAFQKAAAEQEEEEGVLVRLEELRGRVVATSFDREDLAIITRDYLEVR
jgi:hypothetical protein